MRSELLSPASTGVVLKPHNDLNSPRRPFAQILGGNDSQIDLVRSAFAGHQSTLALEADRAEGRV